MRDIIATGDYPEVGRIEGDGFTVRILRDDHDIESPREWDNLGTMLCGHRGYDLGDAQIREGREWTIPCPACDGGDSCGKCEGDGVVTTDAQTWAKVTHGATVVLPLYLYDHSGISMSAGTFGEKPHYPYSDRWDAGMVGIIFDTTEGRELFGTPLDKVEECLRGEVEAYDTFLRGEVYGVLVEVNSGNLDLDRYFGTELEEAQEAAQEAAGHAEAYVKAERAERAAMEARDIVTKGA